MNTIVGWGLAAIALALGYGRWGWPGAAFALTLIGFWLLLQFSRALRVMRMANGAPVGHVSSAVMLHSKLERGMRLMQILSLTRSLGKKLSAEPEAYEWRDSSGASLRVEFVNGRCVGWQLKRPDDAHDPTRS